jgi:hypothetical protein
MQGHPGTCRGMHGHAGICRDMHVHAWTCRDMQGLACTCMDMHGIGGTCREMAEQILNIMKKGYEEMWKLLDSLPLYKITKNNFQTIYGRFVS